MVGLRLRRWPSLIPGRLTFMVKTRYREIKAGTAGILGTLIFLLAWTIVERVTGTQPKSAPPGTTFHAANKAGATVTPSEQPSVLEQ